MGKTKFRTDEEYLSKLTALLDILSWKTDADWLELKRRDPERAEEERKKTIHVDLAAIVGYFTQLTMKALEDDLLAKKLSPIFEDLAKQTRNYKMFFSTLQRIIAEKHGWRCGLPPDYVERGIEKFERKDWIDRAPDSFRRYMEEFEKYRVKRESGENVMFA